MFGAIRGFIKGVKREAIIEDPTDENFWEKVDISLMTRLELRIALESRGLSVKGNKKRLQERLITVVREEKEEELAYLALLEARARQEAEQEAAGSVYTIGDGSLGQLAIGVNDQRDTWQVILEMRGKGIKKVFTGLDGSYALSDNGEVYGWGGGGVGPAGYNMYPDAKSISDCRDGKHHLTMQIIDTLSGEGIVSLSRGIQSAAAVSDGGDCFTWGDGRFGQLGHGTLVDSADPKLVEALQVDVFIKQVSVGQSHMVALTDKGEVYTWGFGANGRLGVGAEKRAGVSAQESKFFPSPCKILPLNSARVKQISCGPTHTVVISDKGVYSWGEGSGGRLGHGDMQDRFEPALIEALSNEMVLAISCGVWHNMAIVMVAPMKNCGQLFTWGSGHHGQLAQGDKKISLIPCVSKVCVDMHLNIVSIKAGQFHSGFMTMDKKLYTYGSNTYGCLGRPDVDEIFTPIPGEVVDFGRIVGKTPRGLVADYDCGRDFTIVCTHPYDGPTVEEVDKNIEDEKDLEIMKKRQAKYKAKLVEQERKLALKKKERDEFLEAIKLHPLCKICQDKGTPCIGFMGNVFKPDICKECGHRRVQHSIENIEEKKRMEEKKKNDEFNEKYGYGEGKTEGNGFVYVYGQVYVIDLLAESNTTLIKQIQVNTCAGLFNRVNGSESVFTISYPEDNFWLSEIVFDEIKKTKVDEFLQICYNSKLVKGRIRINYAGQLSILPNLITMSAVKDAIMMEDDDNFISFLPVIVFDSIIEMKDFTPLQATEYMYVNYLNETFGLSKMNPGWDISKNPLFPKLTGTLNPSLIDFIVSAKLFNFFLVLGCLPLTNEHAMMKKLAYENNWPKPLAVYGYDDSLPIGGGDLFEAETLCSLDMGQVASSGVNNLSFYKRNKEITTPLPQNPMVTNEVYNSSKTYMTLVVGDGDNLAYMKGSRREWMLQRVNSCTSDVKKCFPLVWTASPHLLNLAPEMMKWYYYQSYTTKSDYFILPPSGHLYAYPSLMSDQNQKVFVSESENDAFLMSTNAIVSWEFLGTWSNAVKNYFPKYSTNNLINACFAMNVPYFTPMPFLFGDEKFLVLNETVIFKPRSWRGTQGPQDFLNKPFYISPADLAKEINDYPLGTVGYIYMTSDGGFKYDDLVDMVPLLDPHVSIVDQRNIAHMAIQKNKIKKNTSIM